MDSWMWRFNSKLLPHDNLLGVKICNQSIWNYFLHNLWKGTENVIVFYQIGTTSAILSLRGMTPLTTERRWCIMENLFSEMSRSPPRLLMSGGFLSSRLLNPNPHHCGHGLCYFTAKFLKKSLCQIIFKNSKSYSLLFFFIFLVKAFFLETMLCILFQIIQMCS